jgi:hypothetical protein
VVGKQATAPRRPLRLAGSDDGRMMPVCSYSESDGSATIRAKSLDVAFDELRVAFAGVPIQACDGGLALGCATDPKVLCLACCEPQLTAAFPTL